MCKWLNDLAVKSQPWTWVVLRVIAGIMFMMHGLPKLFGERAASITGGMGLFGMDVGLNMMFVAGLIEVVGGLFLVLGLFTRWSALAAALLMVMAYLHAHTPMLGSQESWFNPLANGGELALMYLFVWLVFFAYGPGRYSLDETVCKKWCGTKTTRTSKKK